MLTDELLANVKRLQIATRRRASGSFTGEYTSAFRGHGMEFDEVRAYQPGDDVRSIDWNVTARTGDPFIKRYVEERELTAMLAVDVSASGSFGSRVRAKREAASRIAALLAFTANRSRDRAGLMLFSDRVERFVPPRRGRNHTQRIIRELLECEPIGLGTDIAGACEHLSRTIRRHAVVFLISDFVEGGPAQATGGPHGQPPAYEHALRLLAKRHDVVALRLTDPFETEPPRAGILRLRDAERGAHAMVDLSSRRVRRAISERAERSAHVFRRTMLRLRIDHADISTDADEVRILAELFRRREARQWR